jgi:hypothetical protein
MVNRLPEQLHYLLTEYVIETGHAPDLVSLSVLAGRSENETEHGLIQLEQMHVVILFIKDVEFPSIRTYANRILGCSQ